MPKLATMQRYQGLGANRQFDANQADTTESRAASHIPRDNQTHISTKPTTTLSVEHLPPRRCGSRLESLLRLTVRRSGCGDDRVRPKLFPAVSVEAGPSTCHLDRFKTIGSHGVATDSSSASEALYASTVVSHLGG